MSVCESIQKKKADANGFVDAVDEQMVGWMRIVLAVSVLLAVLIDPSGLKAVKEFTWLVFFGYFIYSILIYIYSQLESLFLQGVLVYRVDVFWFALIVTLTGSVDSFFFLLFFFAILTSSLKWGFEEGARITIASAFLYAMSGFLTLDEKNELSRLLLRTTFLLVIGYMSAYWGGAKVRLMGQLTLLRDVSRISNPRFGVDHTINTVLERIRHFYTANSCVLVMRNNELDNYWVRTIKKDEKIFTLQANEVNAEIALPLLGAFHDHLVNYKRVLFSAMSPFVQESLVYDCKRNRWQKEFGCENKNLADLLEANFFISAPITLTRQKGRIYIISGDKSFKKSDVEFLSHIAGQVFPVIENIELLDKMASQAALQERYKISLDIHDATIQPYIGLKMGLSGLRKKATADNPIAHDIDKLMYMADKVIDDLRHYAVTIRTETTCTEKILLVALNQQATRIRDLYGINIIITMAHDFTVSDRLATEVLQLVREGLSNICRHTISQKGMVNLWYLNNYFFIQIKNDELGVRPNKFLPRSICERTARLGGEVSISRGDDGNTSVNIQIPV